MPAGRCRPERLGLAKLDRELDDLTGAEAHQQMARVLAERACITEKNRHKWLAAMARLRAAGGDSTPP